MHRRLFLRSLALTSTGCLAACRLPDKTTGIAKRHLPVNPAPSPARAGKTPGLPGGTRLTYLSCKVNGNYAAMTFDDGPHGVLTPRLLDMLKDWGLKATFYLVGRNAAAFPKIVNRTVEEGHEVGNHSWSHRNLSLMTDDQVRNELRSTHDAIHTACGVSPATFRLPYGAITALQKEWIAGEFGYPTILWNVDTNDWRDHVSFVVSQRILKGARSGAIILAHDIHPTTVQAMPPALPVLRDSGVKFLTVSALIAMEAKRAPAIAAADLPSPLFSPGSF